MRYQIFRICKIIIAFLFSCRLFAQEELLPPPAKFVATVPFTQLTGGIMILHATFDDFTDTLNFVLDTGSGGISLDSFTCDYYRIPTVPSDKIVRGIAGMKYVSFANGHTLHLQGMTVTGLDFHINDYEILTAAYGMRIDGIIGYSFFRRYIIAIDYDNMEMKVYEPGTYKYPRGGYLLKPKFTNLAKQMVQVRDKADITSQYYFDSGAGLCLLMTEDFMNDNSIFRTKRKFFATQAEGLGGKAPMTLSLVKDVKVGPYRFHNVPVYVLKDRFSVISYPEVSGLLGNDLMRRFNTVFNYPQQEIYIKPNKHYLDSFDYSYTGLGFYLINGAITVTDIIKDSPAEKAGFKEGDISIGVETNFSNNIQAYKVLMQVAKSKLRVVIMRNGQPLVIELKVRSIR